MNYLEKNRNTWNAKTDIHIKSDFYSNDSFLKGRNSLNDIELKILGDIKNLSILHLQCHFGQDTISLARLGANATGVDFSEKSIDNAKNFARQTNTKAKFICSGIYELPKYLDQQFDLVFTSYGTIGWLPDISKWAEIIARYLKPGGRFIFVDFHPVVWMFDDDFKMFKYNYFNDGPIIESCTDTYTDHDTQIQQETVSWNHSISEVINNLLHKGLEINSFDEFDYSPYDCFNETVEFEPNGYRIKHLENKIPMVYAISATMKTNKI